MPLRLEQELPFPVFFLSSWTSMLSARERHVSPATWARLPCGAVRVTENDAIDHCRSQRRSYVGRRNAQHLARLLVGFLLVGF